MSKTSNTIVAVAALVLFCGVPAVANAAAPVSLFSFETQATAAPPAFGISKGTVLVESTDPLNVNNFSGAAGLVAGLKNQLLLDTSGGTPFFGDVVSEFDYSFSAASATSYAFSYSFFTSQAVGGVIGSNDYLQVVLFDAFNTQTTLAYADATATLSGTSPIPNTGASTVNFNVAPGNYTVQFLVGTAQPDCATGGPVCVTSFAVVSGVPEPSQWLLGLVGGLGLALRSAQIRRRRRSTAL